MLSGQFQVGLYVDLCEVTLGSIVTTTEFKALMKFIQEQETS
jgi:hypothetical protein